MRVQTDYSRRADFRGYRTYSWIKVTPGNSVWTDRIELDVDAQLAQKGWKVQLFGGEAAIAAFGSTQRQHSVATFYSGFSPGLGGWDWQPWGRGETGAESKTTEDVPVGTLVIDIFDARTKQMIWRGAVSSVIAGNPQKKTIKLDLGVADMFKGFPPATGGLKG